MNEQIKFDNPFCLGSGASVNKILDHKIKD